MSLGSNSHHQTYASTVLRVLVESPFSAPNKRLLTRNIAYARACLHDSFLRGEAPWCSHLIYTQAGVLDDDELHQRQLGIDAGLAWGRMAELSAVYVDLGLSRGMLHGIKTAEAEGRAIVYRGLPIAELARLRIKPVELIGYTLDRAAAWPHPESRFKPAAA